MKPQALLIIPKRLAIVYVALLLCSFTVVAGGIRLSQSAVSFDTSFTSTTDSLSFWIINEGTDTVRVSDMNMFEGVFTARDTQFTILPDDSVRAWIYFSSAHNLAYSDVGVIESNGAGGALAFTISGVKQYPDSYYSSTQGLWGDALKTALKNLVAGHTNRGYNTIRDKIFLEVDPVGGQLECVYTGRRIAVTNRSDMQSNGNFNTEHTWPQSKFNENEPERADINHLFPTDETANNRRSNYPFDVVVSNPPTWSEGGSKLGRNSANTIVFEPRDAHKGDLARAMFYFIIRYQNWGSFWNDAGVNQEAIFRIWNKQDPVSAKETARNTAIAQPGVQGKRNPFIDHPEFVDRISRFDGTALIPSNPKIIISPMQADAGIAAPGDTTRYQLAIVNAGNNTLTMSSISSSNPVFSVTAQNSIPAHSFIYATLRFSPTDTSEVYSGTITFTSNDVSTGAVIVNVTGSSSGLTAIGDEPGETPERFTLAQNYPNPFNPATIIHYSLPAKQGNGFQAYYVTLTISDALGRVVVTLVEGMQDAGDNTVRFDASSAAGGLPSGIYFYRLTADSFTEMKKMVLMR